MLEELELLLNLILKVFLLIIKLFKFDLMLMFQEITASII